MSLHPVVGHEDLRGTLARAYARATLPSSLLLHGPRGVGKQRLALWTAQLLVCDAPSDTGPCEVCGPCRMAGNLEHPDVHWYFPLTRPKGASGDRLAAALEDARTEQLAERRVEALRSPYTDDLQALYLGTVKNVRRRAHVRPTMAKGQVFIVGEAESLVPQESSPEAANALLKLLEEPPGDSRFILTSSEPGLLLPTIRSRTVPLHVPPLPGSTVRDFLTTSLEIDAKTAAWAADLAHGSIGRALGFLPDGDDRGPLEVVRRRAYTILEAVFSHRPGAGHALAMRFPPAKARTLLDLFAFLEEWLRDLAAVTARADDRLFNTDAREALRRLAASSGVSGWSITRGLSAIEEARELARGNVNPQLIISGLVRRLRDAVQIDAEVVAR